MRLIKTFYKGRPEVSRTPHKSFKKAWLTDSLKVNPSDSISRCTGVLLPTTSTYSSSSSAVIVAYSPGMGRLSPSLIKSLQRTNDCTPKSAATHAVSMWTNSGFSKLTSSSLLSNFSSGTSRFLVENSLTSSRNLSDGLTLRRADVFYNHNTLLCID